VYQKLNNTLNQDVTFGWDGDSYTIKSNSSILLPDFIAKHGAKKLADIGRVNFLNNTEYAKRVESFLGEVENEADKEQKESIQETIAKETAELQKEEPKEEEFAGLEEIKKRGRPPKK
jgi:phosphorylcholine metabolism protein LicD